MLCTLSLARSLITFVGKFFCFVVFYCFYFGVFDSLIVQLQVAQYVITRLYRFCLQRSTQTITFQSKRKRSQQRCKTDRTTNIANINLLCLNVNSVLFFFFFSFFWHSRWHSLECMCASERAATVHSYENVYINTYIYIFKFSCETKAESKSKTSRNN